MDSTQKPSRRSGPFPNPRAKVQGKPTPRPRRKPSPARQPMPPKPMPAPTERLQKILSRAGIASRRKAEELIQAGHVRLNGQVVTQLGTKANPRTDRITIDGRPLRLADEPLYILFHKPVGVVTTLSDPEGRPTVRDYLRGVRARVFPVGRLDFHSSGLLLLTNDGELALRLTHPRYGIRKTYRVKVKGSPTPEALAQLAAGVRLEEGVTAPAEVRIARGSEGKTWLEITLGEGRRREVRRMCEQVGYPVEKLSRTRLGPLTLGKLPPGEHRMLTEREVRQLHYAVGLG
jgi:23S rRNA pseudouridine2605 synthase